MHFSFISLAFKSFSTASHSVGVPIFPASDVTSLIREPAGTPALIDPLRTLHIAALVNVKQNATAK